MPRWVLMLVYLAVPVRFLFSLRTHYGLLAFWWIFSNSFCGFLVRRKVQFIKLSFISQTFICNVLLIISITELYIFSTIYPPKKILATKCKKKLQNSDPNFFTPLTRRPIFSQSYSKMQIQNTAEFFQPVGSNIWKYGVNYRGLNRFIR